MALNFGLLDQGGPTNFFEGYSQGREKMQANAMAQQRAAQVQQEFGMRQQEFAAGQADKQRVAKAAVVTQKTASARDAILRAPTAADARRIVEMQYADPDLGPIRGRFGSLAQALAEIPEEASAFQQYKEQEAMGMEAFLKQQGSNRAFTTAMGGAPQTNAMGAAHTNAMVAPAMSGELQNFISQRSRLAMLADQSPQVKATINRLDSDIARLVEEQKPEPGFTLSPGQTRYPRAYAGTGVVTAPAAAAAAVKPPDKVAIMIALGYPLTPAGNEAYETAIRAKPTVAAPSGDISTMTSLGIPITPEGYKYFQELKTKEPVVAAEARTPEEKNAELIALGAGPKGSPEFNAALRAEVLRMTAKPAAAVKAEPTTNEMTNAKAIALKAGPEGSEAFNAMYFAEMSRMTAKPITAPEATTPDIKNATALALLKGERGTAAFNKEFVKQMEKSTAKSSGGGEGGGAAVPKAPSGYRFNKAGDLEPIPGGPAAGKPMTDLQKQGLKKDFAADTSKIKAAVDTADEMEKLTDDLVGNTDKKIKPHPGLSGITGYQGLLASFPESPVTSGNAAKAEQKLETFKGKIKALGRSIASLDGKLGNMAVQEWQMVSDSVQAIKPTAGNLEEQMRDAVRQARLLAKNLRDKFDLTYEDTIPAAAPGKPAAAALAPADKQALDWANANPKDPRSLQIKQRLGQ
jgi:hypothetical protein